MDGHAIECRVYAEDADAGFIPATGRLALVRFPSGEGIRIDHGVVEGEDVSASFDPMLAKLAAWAPTRAEAIARAREALRRTVLLGTITNTAFLERVLAQPAFAAGATHTGFIDEHAEALASPPVGDDVQVERFLLAAAALASRRFDQRLAVPDPLAAIGDWRT
jgi:acetyl/propionyl-CoA carboxylase alpha subunit